MKAMKSTKKKNYAEGGKVLGSGMAGRAEAALRGRGAKLEAALAESTGSNPKKMIAGAKVSRAGRKAPPKR